MGWTFVDLFAGIGGFHAALSALGGECVLAVEKDEEAARVYEANWGVDPRGDVTVEGWTDQLQPGDVDVVVGGFPCQPFSKSGVQLGMEEARGTLFFNICEAIEAWKPAVVMLENVRNLAGPRHTHEWDVIIRSLRSLGYLVSAEPVVLSPHWLPRGLGGRPQTRERVFILATRTGAGAGAGAGAGSSKTIELNRRSSPAWEITDDLPLETGSVEERCTSEELNWIQVWNWLVEQLQTRGVEVPQFPIWVDSWYSSSSLSVSGAPAWKQRIEEKNRRFYLENREFLENWVQKFDVLELPASRRKFEWQAQDARGLSECLIQFRPSGVRVKKATTSGALVAIDQRPILGWEERRLTVRECARLQGLPDWFTFDSVGKRAAFKQLGNGVNVGAAYYALRMHLLAPETRAALGRHPLLAAALEAPLDPSETLEGMKKPPVV